jgi:hypothetical protein
MRTSKLGLSLALTLVLAAGGMATGAWAKRHAPKRPLTFTGTCRGTGTVTFRPPLTNTPKTLTQHAIGPLACSGTLRDRRGRTHDLNKARVIYDAREGGDNISCAVGIDGGTGALRFRWGLLRFTVSEKRVAAVATLSYSGARGGSASATAIAGGDPATVVRECGGDGIKRIPASLDLDAGDGISG